MPYKDPATAKAYSRKKQREYRLKRGVKPRKVWHIGERVDGTHLTYMGPTAERDPSGHRKSLWKCDCGGELKCVIGQVSNGDSKCCGKQCPYKAKNDTATRSQFIPPTAEEQNQHFTKAIADPIVSDGRKNPRRCRSNYKPSENSKHAMRRTRLTQRMAAGGMNYSYGKYRVVHKFDDKIYSFGGFEQEEDAFRVSKEVIAYYAEHHAVPLHLVRVRQKLQIGDKIEHLTYRGLIAEWESGGHRLSLWDCDCGTIGFKCPVGSVMSENTRSCGCVHSEYAKDRWQKHREQKLGLKVGEKVAGTHLTYQGVIDRWSPAGKRYATWNCDACGKIGYECLVSSVMNAVKKGSPCSCGCIRNQRPHGENGRFS